MLGLLSPARLRTLRLAAIEMDSDSTPSPPHRSMLSTKSIDRSAVAAAASANSALSRSSSPLHLAQSNRCRCRSCLAQLRLGLLDVGFDPLTLWPGEFLCERIQEHASPFRHQSPARKYRPRAHLRQTPIGQHLDKFTAL